jgi:D-alanyl-lipoteichoic acid acyltransferase DltB (MBOAT superfamily)
MLFNSIEYALFLPIVFAIYWIIGYLHIGDALKLKLQNTFVLIASYVFYGWWDWRFLLLIAFTSLCSWGSGLLIKSSILNHKSSISKLWLTANIVINIGILAVFKYYDFFVTEFGRLFSISTDNMLLKVILPVGISFYTFQALSYSIDVYRKKVEPTTDIVAFFAFIAFFPQLVAGPIERATNLLPQFLKNRIFQYGQAVDGLRQILWGLFKKMAIADTCAIYVNRIWETYDMQSSGVLILGAVLFTFQIYGDFSGYSDIAIGTAKLFGINLMRNFNSPYFSRDIAEFWRRWHISLTTWFRDYVYIPLGGSRVSKAKIIRNTFIIFLVSGLWHGANWTFLAWGAFHAILFLPLILLGWNRRYTDQPITWRHLPQILCTFVLVVFGWILFRAESITQAWRYICGIAGQNTETVRFVMHSWEYIPLIFTIVFMIGIEWINRAETHSFAIQQTISNQWLRRILYVAVVLMILYLGQFHYNQFIYFQF